jgi:hypothetical protein
MSVTLAGGVRHPKIYAYTTNESAALNWKGKRTGCGVIKVGYTEKDVDARIRQQLHGVKMPVTTPYELLVSEAAVTDDGRVFTDHEVHRMLERAGYRRDEGEWFECTKDELIAAIQAVREGRDLPPAMPTRNFAMRPEQRQAVEMTAAYFRGHDKAENGKAPDFLWNAKMRFGKTFASYQLAKEMGWTRVLVLTYKPAVEQAWREDLLGHRDFTGWRFKGKHDNPSELSDRAPLVWFASFQDVLGKDDGGNPKAKNRDLYRVEWDVVIIDEYHFGAWRDAARSIYVAEVDELTGEKTEGDKTEAEAAETPDLDEGFVEGIEEMLSDSLSIGHYLYLSGTPFRALTQGEFLEDQVFNWTYSDEQRAKRAWAGDTNPYAALPEMHLLTYEMPEKLKEVSLNNLSEFSLTEFFRTTKDRDSEPHFVHEVEVQRWVDLLRGQDLPELWSNISITRRPPMPFEDVNLLTALQHTVWYLPGIDACLAMRDLLGRSHNRFFHDYTIVVAAGNEVGTGEDALPPVEEAITNVPQATKSITLSCGKLMTGVTVPAWTGIFMLRELKSPETYFQAAFRVQSPWSYKFADPEVGGEREVVVKEHCYVLDFSPNRALRLIVEYATKLRAGGNPAEFDETAAIEEFMEFLPVLAFDGSSMNVLHAGDVIDFLTKGVSSSMLARRWNSPELITLDLKALEAILADAELVDSLEQIEMFRNFGEDLSALISSNKELRPKSLSKQKLSREERQQQDEAKKKRDSIKQKLQRFLTRIPAFMYLTDDRERAVYDIITQVEPQLFEKVTTLSLKDFERLVNAGAFNVSKMNDAVWKFRQFEEPSLSYTRRAEVRMRGGWSQRRDERFARLIEMGILVPGDSLLSPDPAAPVTAIVTDDYGLSINGIRQESPDLAAQTASDGGNHDGWSYWTLVREGRPVATLQALRAK